MKYSSFLALGAVVVLALSLNAPSSLAATTSTPAERSITVSAEGTVHVKPDVAFVSAGVIASSPQASAAQASANRATTQAIRAIEHLGIASRDIQTVDISLDPQYDPSGTLTGFQASDTLSIQVMRVTQTGAVIDAAVGAGANHNLSVSFGLKDDSAAQTSALKVAVANGQRKAAAVAAQLGLSLANARIQVTENNQQPGPIYATQSVRAPSASLAVSTPVQAGTLTIQDDVTLTYTL